MKTEKNKIPAPLANAREIKQWMKERKTTKPPVVSSKYKYKEENRLGVALNYIRQRIIKPYKAMTEEEKNKYREEHPEIDEILEIIEEIENNNVPAPLANARAIKKWMEEKGTTKPPTPYSKDKEEKRLGVALYDIRQKIIKPYKAMTEEEKNKYREEHPEIDEILEIVEEIDKNKEPVYLRNARATKKWMEERGGTKRPSNTAKDEEERKLGVAFNYIRNFVVKPYKEMSEEKRAKYMEEHPEIDEILKIVEEIEEKEEPAYLRNARAIKQWMEERETTKPPAASSKDEEEKRLGRALINIRSNIVKLYKGMPEEKRAEYRKEHPETDEILGIIEKIDRNNVPTYLANARTIRKWMEERGTTKTPSSHSKDKEEKSLGLALSTIRHLVIKPYQEMTEEERAEYREEHPEIDEILEIVGGIDNNKVPTSLANARKIKKWMEEIGTTKPPSKKSEDKEEKRLWKALYNIRYYLIKKYREMEEEGRFKYREKYPEIDEILAIVEEIDRNNVPISLANARAIKEWMEERKTTKPPAERSKNKEEKKLAVALNAIKHNIIKPYKAMTEEESAEYREKHPEIDEILGIVEKIDRENVPVNLENARAIKKWMEKNNTSIPPRAQNKKKTVPEEEVRLGTRLRDIRSNVIKPYQAMSEEERVEYRVEHPEIDEILLIISEIDSKRGKKSEELDSLVEEARKRMEMLKQAKELEAMYEEQLGKTKAGKTGVDINE